MNKKSWIIFSFLFVCISVMAVVLFLPKFKTYTIYVLDPANNTSYKIKAKSGTKFKDYLKPDSDNFKGYYLDNQFNIKINLNDYVSKSISLTEANVASSTVENLNKNVYGIKLKGYVNSDNLNFLCNTYKYLDLSAAEVDGKFPAFNAKITTLILNGNFSVNNFTNLNTVFNYSKELTNSFNNCPNLKYVYLNNILNLSNCFNDCSLLSEISLNKINQITGCFINTLINKININSSEYFVQDDVLYKKADLNNGKTIVKGLIGVKNLSIADTYKIEDYAFSGITNNFSLTCTDNMLSIIGENAFSMSNITGINLAGDIVVGKLAFYKCSQLKNINFTKNITFAEKSFMQSGIQNLDFTNSNVSIQNYAFADCNNLKTVKFGDNVVNLGKGAFSGCTSLSKVQNLHTQTISEYCFSDCINLYDIGEINGLVSVQNYAFKNTNLLSLNGVSSVVNINVGAFENCKNLQNAKLFNLQQLHENAFKNCINLTEFYNFGNLNVFNNPFTNCPIAVINVFGDAITQVDDAIFNKEITQLLYYAKNSTQTTFSIPNTVTKINVQSLSNAINLSNISVQSGGNYYSQDGILYSKDKSTLLCYPSAKTQAEFTLPSFVNVIAENSFYECKNLTKITILQNITTIQNASFVNMQNLQILNTPFLGNNLSDVTNGYIGYMFGAKESMLSGYFVPSSLKEVTVTNQSFMPDNAFFDCYNIQKIVLKNVSILSINMFYNCTNLRSVIVEKPLTKINNAAFYNTIKLTSFSLVYSKNLVVNVSALNNCSKNVTATLQYSENLTNSDFNVYKAKFGQQSWTWKLVKV